MFSEAPSVESLTQNDNGKFGEKTAGARVAPAVCRLSQMSAQHACFKD